MPLVRNKISYYAIRLTYVIAAQNARTAMTCRSTWKGASSTDTTP